MDFSSLQDVLCGLQIGKKKGVKVRVLRSMELSWGTGGLKL